METFFLNDHLQEMIEAHAFLPPINFMIDAPKTFVSALVKILANGQREKELRARHTQKAQVNIKL
jgi:hypothetical protein